MAETANLSSVENSRLAGSPPPTAFCAPTFEKRLDENLAWAMSEGDRYFEERGSVHEALRRIARRLDELGVPYAVAGGLALFSHGYRRFTEDVDILVTAEGLNKIHEELEGRGYLPPFELSKHLRDTELGVKIEFLVAGEYPGDGKPKPVAFPDPSASSEVMNGIRFLRLATLIELKIASGMTGADRQKDLVDVQELIKLFALPHEFSDNLNPYVQEKYRDLWTATRPPGVRYILIWRTKVVTRDANSLDDLIGMHESSAEQLKAMQRDGLYLDPSAGITDAYLVTTDPDTAKKYGMHDERDFLKKVTTKMEAKFNAANQQKTSESDQP